jgi:hypothetical protein
MAKHLLIPFDNADLLLEPGRASMMLLYPWLRHWRKMFTKTRQRPRVRLECEQLEIREARSVSPAGSAFLALTGQSFSQETPGDILNLSYEFIQ